MTIKDCFIRPRRCDRKWTGFNQAHCSSCHEHFSTVKNFDLHRPGKVRADGTAACGKPAEMTRTKRDGTKVPLFREVETVNGPMWVSYTEDTRNHDEQENES